MNTSLCIDLCNLFIVNAKCECKDGVEQFKEKEEKKLGKANLKQLWNERKREKLSIICDFVLNAFSNLN